MVYPLWRGWTVKPSAGDWSLLRQHINEVICSDNDQNFRYLIRWIAFMFQFPWIPPGVSVVARSEYQGVGKGIVTDEFNLLYGRHAVEVSKPDELVGRFNDGLEGSIFLHANEAMFAGNPKQVGPLYAIITDRLLRIEPKGLPAYSVPNMIHAWLSTNEKWAVPAKAHGRRFFVTECLRSSSCGFGCQDCEP